MIIYQKTKGAFLEDILDGKIEIIILEAFRRNKQAGGGDAEVRSWQNSLNYMNTVLTDPEIPTDCGVAIEYTIPQTSKRLDFILTGTDDALAEHAILIELKQWSKVELTEKDAVVRTWLGRGWQETNHPSYQAWSYATLLEGFNETIDRDGILLKPCAYLHNYVGDGVINHEFYQPYIDKAPLFLRTDIRRLQDFIKQFLRQGDQGEIMYRIEQGRIRPSKVLADSLASMLDGNEEFVMIDDQKIVYETALALARKSSEQNKHVLIVEGGPGTGKSVVAINLLVQLTRLGLFTQYVSKNAAPRAVYQEKLRAIKTQKEISYLFRGSGSFVDAVPNSFGALIVDEAHRLNEKSGLYGNLGENQIKELIRSACFSVFFVDEDQKVTLNDIGDKESIRSWAAKAGADVYETELSSQFRCNGSDGYLAWLDHVLQIRETANDTLEGVNYDFRVLDSPVALRDAIFEKNKERNKARLVGGYCWDWNSKKNPQAYDVVIPEYDFQMRWNLTAHGSSWLIKPDSINEIGCIHTTQGLEMDYVGVIIGPDLVVREGRVLTDPAKRSKMDQSIRGWRTLMKEDPEGTKTRLRAIIKNTYRTLMTRGMKGCYVYFTDKETEAYFREMTAIHKIQTA